jgi:hypothetical protein
MTIVTVFIIHHHLQSFCPERKRRMQVGLALDTKPFMSCDLRLCSGAAGADSPCTAVHVSCRRDLRFP